MNIKIKRTKNIHQCMYKNCIKHHQFHRLALLVKLFLIFNNSQKSNTVTLIYHAFQINTV